MYEKSEVNEYDVVFGSRFNEKLKINFKLFETIKKNHLTWQLLFVLF